MALLSDLGVLLVCVYLHSSIVDELMKWAVYTACAIDSTLKRKELIYFIYNFKDSMLNETSQSQRWVLTDSTYLNRCWNSQIN